jgi:AraC-like DNA-binding protein
MTYYEDIRYIMGGRQESCDPAMVSGRWPEFYSLQFDRSNRISYEVDGRPQVIVDAPVMYLTHPEKSYRFGPCDDGAWDHSFIAVTGPRATRIFEEGLYPLSSSGTIPIHRPQECAEIFDHCIEVFQSAEPIHHHEAVIGLERLLGLLMDNQRMEAPELPFAEDIRDLGQKIEMAPFEPWDFEVCARELCISYSHFRKLFREHLKRSPHDFLLSARMRRAARILQLTSKSVKEISQLCDYDDLARFSKVFKKKIGLSPRQFRNSLRLG